MRKNHLGKSELRVSEIGLGCMTFGKNQWGAGSLNEKEANELVSIALDSGVNLFDTADVYAFGESEEILGKALKGRRGQAVIATKVGIRMGDESEEAGLSRRHILKSAEDSLRRLQTDTIDLYQVHGWDPQVPLEETLRALEELVKSGKVRVLGCSNFSGWQLARSLWISEAQKLSRFESLQPKYSLAAREAEWDLVPLCENQSLAFLPWSPLSGGFLTGKYHSGKSGPRGARWSSPKTRFPLLEDEKKGHRIVAALREIAKKRNASVAQAALRWLLEKPFVTSVLIGARAKEQILDNLGCVSWKMSEDDLARLDEVSAISPGYPYNMQNMLRGAG